jgi:hypothetical protein
MTTQGFLFLANHSKISEEMIVFSQNNPTVRGLIFFFFNFREFLILSPPVAMVCCGGLLTYVNQSIR